VHYVLLLSAIFSHTQNQFVTSEESREVTNPLPLWRARWRRGRRPNRREGTCQSVRAHVANKNIVLTVVESTINSGNRSFDFIVSTSASALDHHYDVHIDSFPPIWTLEACGVSVQSIQEKGARGFIPGLEKFGKSFFKGFFKVFVGFYTARCYAERG